MRSHAWIVKKDRTEVYDLESDPGQQHDLAAAQTGLANAGRARVDVFRRQCSEVRDGLVSAPAAPPLDPERRRALEALGYIQ
jgi:hypothetical protein